MNNIFLGKPSASIKRWIDEHHEDPMLPDREGWTNIHNEEEFMQFVNDVNSGTETYSNKKVCLCHDIDLSGIDFPGIGNPDGSTKFMGDFDGRGKTIKNMKIINRTLTQSTGVALFNQAYAPSWEHSTTIENLNLTDCFVSGGYKVAGIVGSGQWFSVKNCNVTGHLEINNEDGQWIGGIVAYAAFNSIENCVFNGEIVNDYMSYGLGGIAACVDRESTAQDTNITNCASHGVMKINGEWIDVEQYGGILGRLQNINTSLAIVLENNYSDMKIYVANVLNKEHPMFGVFKNQPSDTVEYEKLDRNNSWSIEVGEDKQQIKMNPDIPIEGKFIHNNA